MMAGSGGRWGFRGSPEPVQTVKQFPQRDEALMAETYTADSIDGSGNPTGEAKQEYGSKAGTTHEAVVDGSANPTGEATPIGETVTDESGTRPATAKDLASAESKVVSSPRRAPAKKSGKAEGK